MRIDDPATWDKVKDVISEALKRPSSERSAFVRERCADPELCAEIDAMLRAYDEDSQFLEEPPQVDDVDGEDDLADLHTGARIGPYVIIDRLQRGGMGQVFLCSDPRLHRKVALKCLIASRLEGDERRRRILREARAAGRISHQNVATIHDVIEHEGRAFIVMEYVEGESLAARLKRDHLGADAVVAIGRQLTAALAAAHAAGVIHRDLKPANIQLLADGSVKVLDFGVAKALAIASTTAATTKPLPHEAPLDPRDVQAGTPGYMSPEQVLGRDVDDRSDIFSLGVVLYEMTTGRRPFTKSDPLDLVLTMAKQVPRADAADARVPRELADVIAKAMEVNPADRFQTAMEMGLALDRLKPSIVSDSPSATTTGRKTRAEDGAPARSSRREWIIAAAVVAVAALIAVPFVLRRPQPAPFQPRGRLLVADLNNRAGDADLAQVIREGLTIQLQQSPYVNVLSRAQVFDALRRMQKPELAALDEKTAIELCLRENVAVLVTGTVYRSGNNVWIAARGVSPTTRNVLFAENGHFDRSDEVLAQVDSLAKRLRQRLGESMATIDRSSQPLAAVTTTSLEALKLYTRAAEEYARGNPDAAPPLLQQALDRDPKFAMAHRLMARVYETLGNPAKERDHLEKAFELRESLSERERRQVEAAYYNGRGDYDNAASTLVALTSLYPNDFDAHYDLGEALMAVGQRQRAAQEFESAVKLEPTATLAYGRLALTLTQLSDYDRATAIVRQADAYNLKSPQLTWASGMIALGSGRADEARRAFTAMQKSGDVYGGVGRLYLASADIYEGRLAAAVDELEAGIRVDRKFHNVQAERKRRYLLARIHFQRGDRGAARRDLDDMLIGGVDALEAREAAYAGMLFARTGDARRAGDLLRYLIALRARNDSGFVKSCSENVRGEIALAARDDRTAEEAFLAAAGEFPWIASASGLARTYAARRDWPRARAAWEQVLAARGEILFDGYPADWILAHLEAARSSRQSGDVDAARGYYDRFLQLWARTDDVATLRVAAAERSGLSGRPEPVAPPNHAIN